MELRCKSPFTEGQSKGVPGFLSGRGSEGTSGSSICSYENREKAVRHKPLGPLSPGEWLFP